MTVIRASCPDCGDVELGVPDLEVRVEARTERGEYRFCCPSCQTVVLKPAERRIVDMLVASGVALVEWRLPAELYEPHTGSAVTHDDLIDFHRLLQGDDGVVAMVERATRRAAPTGEFGVGIEPPGLEKAPEHRLWAPPE